MTAGSSTATAGVAALEVRLVAGVAVSGVGSDDVGLATSVGAAAATTVDAASGTPEDVFDGGTTFATIVSRADEMTVRACAMNGWLPLGASAGIGALDGWVACVDTTATVAWTECADGFV